MLAIAVLVGAPPANAQVSTTNCQVIGNRIMCNTQQGVMQLQGWGNDLGRNLGNVLNQALAARRQAQARQAYTKALVEAQQRAQAEAEAMQRAAEEASRRAQNEAAIANDREQARQRLFGEKAVSVVLETSAAMNFQGKVQAFWVQAATATLQDLYKVNPEASRLQIYDALTPKIDAIWAARRDWTRRHMASEPLFSRYQALQLPAYPDSLYIKFWDPLYTATEPLFMEWPDETNVARFAEVVEPLFVAAEKRRPASARPGSAAPSRPVPVGTKPPQKKPPVTNEY